MERSCSNAGNSARNDAWVWGGRVTSRFSRLDESHAGAESLERRSEESTRLVLGIRPIAAPACNAMTQPEKEAISMEPMLSVKQAATTLGISVSTLYRMVDEGALRKLKVRNRTVFERAEVERYIQALRADAAAAPRATGIGADGAAKRAVVLLSGGLDSAT